MRMILESPGCFSRTNVSNRFHPAKYWRDTEQACLFPEHSPSDK